MSSNSALELGAPAKLNLFLEVCGKREDGYHEIDSVFAEIDLHDRLKIAAADEISLSVTGVPVPADEANLAWRAAAILGVGAAIEIDKQIPVGGGLGGGSSNAAVVLLALDQIYQLGLSDDDLLDLATDLGADVPFFLQGGLARCRGIGDDVEAIANPPKTSFLVVIPPFSTSTADVFRGVPPLTETPEEATVFLSKYCGGSDSGPAPYFNRLQMVAEGLDPRLKQVRAMVEERFERPFCMSGSGSSYFAEVSPHDAEGLSGADGLEFNAEPVRVLVARTG